MAKQGSYKRTNSKGRESTGSNNILTKLLPFVTCFALGRWLTFTVATFLAYKREFLIASASRQTWGVAKCKLPLIEAVSR